MYINVTTRRTLTDKEFLSNEFEDLMYEATLDNDSFDKWLNENYSAADVFYFANTEQEEEVMEKWKEHCKKSIAANLLDGALDSYYVKYTDGWKYVEGDK